jgi:hypothetical protein
MNQVTTLVVHMISDCSLDALISQTYNCEYEIREELEIYCNNDKLIQGINGKLSEADEKLLTTFKDGKRRGCTINIILNDLVRNRKLPSGNILIKL